jgi:hypothetical protein
LPPPDENCGNSTRQSKINKTLAPSRPCEAARRPWPGIGPRGSTRQASGLQSRARALAGVCGWRHGGTGPWTWGPCCRSAASCARRAPPCPSQTRLGGEPLPRRQTEAVLWGVGAALQHAVEHTRLCCASGVGDARCGRGQVGRSAAPWLRRQPLGALVGPWLAPGGHGVALDLRGLGEVLERGALATPSQTMGARPRSAGGVILPRFFSACALCCGQRLHLSHDHPRLRSWGISHQSYAAWMRSRIGIVPKNF